MTIKSYWRDQHAAQSAEAANKLPAIIDDQDHAVFRASGQALDTLCSVAKVHRMAGLAAWQYWQKLRIDAQPRAETDEELRYRWVATRMRNMLKETHRGESMRVSPATLAKVYQVPRYSGESDEALLVRIRIKLIAWITRFEEAIGHASE